LTAEEAAALAGSRFWDGDPALIEVETSAQPQAS
jgi:hypothetical protein